jgi:hypothetical protein
MKNYYKQTYYNKRNHSHFENEIQRQLISQFYSTWNSLSKVATCGKEQCIDRIYRGEKHDNNLQIFES